MKITRYEDKYLSDIVRLWNDDVCKNSIFKPLSLKEYQEKVIKNKYFDKDGFIIILNDDNDFIGYGHAIVSESPYGFITSIVVTKKYQRLGYGTIILQECEKYLKSKDKNTVRLYFASPINFEWIVPNTIHEHPGAPAIEVDSPLYYLLVNNGYQVNGQMDGYHLNLDKYELPEKVINKEKENEEKGYYVTYYDPKLHHGFDELFDALKNDGWRAAVNNNLAKEKPYPMLIVEKDGEILGWTGPLYTQDTGRAYLAGIGVHPKTQGLGLGKSLFCELCYRSKQNGGKFMTLFTGIDNLARNIYLYAGFRIVKSFVILRKELK